MDEEERETTLDLLVAKALGYLVGFGSLMLYTPIGVRICVQQHADGLVLSTWWLKLSSYLLSDAYYIRKQYDLSTYAETVVITIESAVILGLVAVYQSRTSEVSFWVLLIALVIAALYGFTIAPDAISATGQLSSAFVTTAALIPQFHHNYTTKTKGDYSPLTATLAWLGCLIRIFTTKTLNGGDPILMLSFFTSFSANLALVMQILYYGIYSEGLTFQQVFLADVTGTEARHERIIAEDTYDGLPEPSNLERTNRIHRIVPTSTDSGSLSENPVPSEMSSLRRRPALELPDILRGANPTQSNEINFGEGRSGYDDTVDVHGQKTRPDEVQEIL